jgi:hypothetical protein
MDALATGADVDMRAAEQTLRDAAMTDAAGLFAALASAIEPSVPKCPVCGKAMQSNGRHPKDVVSLMGPGVVYRRHYSCPVGCGTNAIPLDATLGIVKTSYTPALRQSVSTLGAAGPFEWASETLAQIGGIDVSPKQCQRIAEESGRAADEKRERLRSAVWSEDADGADTVEPPFANTTLYMQYDGTGIPMMRGELVGRKGKSDDGMPKTREAKMGCIFTSSSYDEDGKPIRDADSTSYFGAIETAESFSRRLWAEAKIRGFGLHLRTAIIADGARWIWNIADLMFPGAIQIVDCFHAKEHAFALARLVAGVDTPEDVAQAILLDLLDDGNIEDLVKQARAFAKGRPDVEDATESALGYFMENADRMRYKAFRDCGLFCGSGVIEATCKAVVGQRLKQSGMFWSVDGANAIIALRCADRSGKAHKEYLTLKKAA